MYEERCQRLLDSNSDYYRGTIIFAINIDYVIMNFKDWLKNPGPTYSAGRLPAIFNREL